MTAKEINAKPLRVGEKVEYALGPWMTALAKRVGVTQVWRSCVPETADEKAFRDNLAEFIDIGRGVYVYSIEYKGKEHTCGNMPRDIGKVMRGMAIALGERYDA